jgi:hypothetical protein
MLMAFGRRSRSILIEDGFFAVCKALSSEHLAYGVNKNLKGTGGLRSHRKRKD